jgi:hypothetical protein
MRATRKRPEILHQNGSSSPFWFCQQGERRPKSHLPPPISASVEVGMRSAGPKPRIRFPVCVGVMKKLDHVPQSNGAAGTSRHVGQISERGRDNTWDEEEFFGYSQRNDGLDLQRVRCPTIIAE